MLRPSRLTYALQTLLAVVSLWTLMSCKKPADRPALAIYGAASTSDVMNELARRYSDRTGTQVKTSFASSATIAKQIEAGAPADVFVSANAGWMDYLASKNRLVAGTRRDLLTTSLVVIAPAKRKFTLRIEKGANFADAFEGKLALADPSHAPAGIYAKEALSHFGWWSSIEARVLPLKDVRAVVAAVESGSVGAGIAYTTDLAVSDQVVPVATFPASSHGPILFPIALVEGGKPGAKELFDYLTGEEARAVYEKAGFEVLRTP